MARYLGGNHIADCDQARTMPGPKRCLPLSRKMKHAEELDLACVLKTGANIKGGIFYVYEAMGFEFIPSRGVLETNLELQCPKIHEKSEFSAKDRLIEYTIRMKKGEKGRLCKLFTRVLKGRSTS